MNLKSILSSVAPFIGSMIGGPFGLAAGKLVGRALLGDENASEQDIEKALQSASPEQLVELKKVDAEYKIKMGQLGIDEKKIAAMDRDSARKREMAVGDNIPAILAIMLSVGFFGILLSIMFIPIQESANAVMDVMLGALATAWIGAMTYYFGSSSGSKLKTLIMKESTNEH